MFLEISSPIGMAVELQIQGELGSNFMITEENHRQYRSDFLKRDLTPQETKDWYNNLSKKENPSPAQGCYSNH